MATNAVSFNIPEPVKLIEALLTSNLKAMGYGYEFVLTPREIDILDVDRRTNMERAKTAELFIEHYRAVRITLSD